MWPNVPELAVITTDGIFLLILLAGIPLITFEIQNYLRWHIFSIMMYEIKSVIILEVC